jgi:hypothetical protein
LQGAVRSFGERLQALTWGVANTTAMQSKRPSLGIIDEIEGNIFHVSLRDRFCDFPPTDEPGFLAFANRYTRPSSTISSRMLSG